MLLDHWGSKKFGYIRLQGKPSESKQSKVIDVLTLHMPDCLCRLLADTLSLEINSHPLSSMILSIKLESLAILTKR